MSLQTAAQAVRSRGRGNDTMLIHMTPGEVQGLQSLATAAGGSLTTNPETGLPEAGFLESLLPTLIGAGLTIGTGGMINPLTAGAIVGGIQTVRTGDLGQGLMAGLGAYGGAGLGSSLQAAGAATNAAAAQPGNLGIGSGQALANPVTATQAYTAPTTAMGNFAEAGQGAQSLFSSGTAGDTARNAAMEGFGKYSGLEDRTLGAFGTSFAAAAEPLAYVPPYEAPESKYKSNYKGPYRPAERNVRFPGAERDPSDTSEFQFFDRVNPYPAYVSADEARTEDLYKLAEGGTATASEGGGDFAARLAALQAGSGGGDFASRLSALQAAPAAAPAPGLRNAILSGDVQGMGAPQTAPMPSEADYGFRPMAVQVPEIGQAAAELNPEVKAILNNGGNGAGDNGGIPNNSYDMGYVPGIAADFGRSVNKGLPSALGVVGDVFMGAKGYDYNPVTGDYEQRDYMDGGKAGYSTVSGKDDGGDGPGDGNGYDPNDSYGDAPNTGDESDTFFRAGGMTMDNGGFVIDAHTVSEIGNGSSDAGHMALAPIGGEPIKGPGDGTSDSIRANIGGVQEARIARDESYLSRDDVKALGGGNLKKGEKMLYKLMAEAHKSRKKKGRGQSTGLDSLIKKMAA